MKDLWEKGSEKVCGEAGESSWLKQYGFVVVDCLRLCHRTTMW